MSASNLNFIYDADLLDSDAQVIAQQCNCISKNAKGLSYQIAKRFPHGDFYSNRETPSTPGTIQLSGNRKKKERFILAMFAQYNPGKPRDGDTSDDRVRWFGECLKRTAKIKNLKSIAFPSHIGCGLAVGDWDDYRRMIEEWADEHSDVRVDIIRKEIPVEPALDDISTRIRALTPLQKSLLFDRVFDDIHVHVIISASKFLDEIDPHVETEIFEEKEGDNTSGDDSDDGEEATDEEDFRWDNLTLKEYVEILSPEGWEGFFHNIIEEGGMDDISEFLSKEAEKYTIYPPLPEVFTAFDLCPFEDVKIIIIGQDPYHTPDAAMGVAFGHHDTRSKIQPSLQNIYKALENDGFTANFSCGDLSDWCSQGVFLINTALTVREGDAGSHSQKSKTQPGVWSYFIEQLFRYIAEEKDHLVVMAWGAKAKEYTKFFSKEKHVIIEAPHPAASAYNPRNTEFLEHKPFSCANKHLRKWGYEEIDWNLEEEDSS